jgi:large subunit ribosomal protein L14e
VRKLIEQEGIVEKWDKSAWAQKRLMREKRRSLNDFDRFKVMLAKKQRRDVVRKAVKKASA